jgi:hypothetical protein
MGMRTSSIKNLSKYDETGLYWSLLLSLVAGNWHPLVQLGCALTSPSYPLRFDLRWKTAPRNMVILLLRDVLKCFSTDTRAIGNNFNAIGPRQLSLDSWNAAQHVALQ